MTQYPEFSLSTFQLTITLSDIDLILSTFPDFLSIEYSTFDMGTDYMHDTLSAIRVTNPDAAYYTVAVQENLYSTIS